MLFNLPPSLSKVHMSNSSWPWANEQGIRRQGVLMAYCRQTEKATCDGTFSGYCLIICHCLLLLFQKAYFSFERFSQPLQALVFSRVLFANLRFFWRKSSQTTNTPSGILLKDIFWLISTFTMSLLGIDLLSAVEVANMWVSGLVPPADELALFTLSVVNFSVEFKFESFIREFAYVSLAGINSGVVGFNSHILGCDEHHEEKGASLKLLSCAHWGAATFDSTIWEAAMAVFDESIPLGQTEEDIFLVASSEEPFDKAVPNLGNSSSDDMEKQAFGCCFESFVWSASLSFVGNCHRDDNAGELDDSSVGGRLVLTAAATSFAAAKARTSWGVGKAFKRKKERKSLQETIHITQPSRKAFPGKVQELILPLGDNAVVNLKL